MEPLSVFYWYGDWILFIARLMVGAVMLYFGLPKMRDLRSNAKDFSYMGLHPGLLWGTIVALLETLGGVALILGLFTPFFAGLFAAQMILGTIWKIFIGRKTFEEYSYDLLILALCLVILSFGSGAFSLL